MTDQRTLIQQAMRDAYSEAESRVAQFYAMQAYQLGWRDEQLQPTEFDPGKLLRPRLCLLACRAVGGDPRQALPVAAGIQLVHDFSLIHDDIEDNSETRRGRATVWTLWGLAQGINTGDGMLIVAHLSLHRLVDTGVAPAVALDVLRRFDETILRVCEGQFLDLSYEGKLEISEDDYLAMISRKTAALIAAATGLGALVGGADAASTEALFAFGQALGMAFQIQDDVLGIWGDPTVTGKPFAADLQRRKLSLPVIHALQTSDQRAQLACLYAKPDTSDADLEAMLAILDGTGARAHVEQMAEQYHQQALAALDAVRGDPQALAELRQLVGGLLKRNR